ncbi:MAG TPA: hypothetical protein VLE53_01175 [Gemmatimonadaceae bacterium]|nr:hypothetical protein [Gemmatimonadaceae bacterium]
MSPERLASGRRPVLRVTPFRAWRKRPAPAFTTPPRRARWRRVASPGALIAALLCATLPGGAAGQSGRVTGTTFVQALDVRPLVDDSVPVGLTTGTGPYRQLEDGRLVRCVDPEPYCRYRRPGSRVLATPLVQDLRVTAWGFGEGVSAHAFLRGRSPLGRDDVLWPRADDQFDALEAWVQLDRERLRVRLGRQFTSNGLGVYNFDGGAVTAQRGDWRLEAFGGLSLVEGLNEPHTGDVLAEIDDLPPDENAWVLGGRLGTALGRRGVVSGTYQRVIRTDRASLYSERVAGNLSLRAAGTTVDAGWIHDLVTGEVNDALLRLARPLPRRLNGTLELRRHRPFFETWTIWGAFSPVAFDEARAALGWRDATGRLSVDTRGAWRRYEETNAGLESIPLRTDGWRVGVGAEWSPRDALLWYGDYDVDIGFGASSANVTLGGRWMPDERRFLGAAVTALQNIYEFRVGTGRVLGLHLEGGRDLSRDVRLVLDGAVYAHRLTPAPGTADWSQRRFSVRLEWTVGADPGMAAPR